MHGEICDPGSRRRKRKLAQDSKRVRHHVLLVETRKPQAQVQRICHSTLVNGAAVENSIVNVPAMLEMFGAMSWKDSTSLSTAEFEHSPGPRNSEYVLRAAFLRFANTIVTAIADVWQRTGIKRKGTCSKSAARGRFGGSQSQESLNTVTRARSMGRKRGGQNNWWLGSDGMWTQVTAMKEPG